MLLFLFFSEVNIECFEISLRKVSNSSSWALGSCYSSVQYSEPGVYVEKCCISSGLHVLTCNNDDDDDWSRSPLILQGHEFCNDYVGNKAMIHINLTGVSSI